MAHRYFVNLARSDPDWAWLLIRLDVSHNSSWPRWGRSRAATSGAA